MIPYNKSQEILQNIKIVPKKAEKVFISNSLNRVLAKDIIAQENLPLERTSAMDGYAIKHSEIENELEILGKTPAGYMPTLLNKKNSCIKTFTGSLMPKDADTLVPIEFVELKNNKIKVLKSVKKGFSVREVGEVYKKGDTLLNQGIEIDFKAIGVLASLGLDQIDVVSKPKVGVISTGSELIEVGTKKEDNSKIYSSNNYTLEALFTSNGANVTRYPLILDDKEQLKTTLKQAIEENDIVVTTGGVSVGDFDFVKTTIKEFGFDELFTKVAIKPGQHIKALHKDNKFIFALPGFAYSASVTAFLYVVSTIKRFLNQNSQPKKVKAILKENYKHTQEKTFFVAVNLYFENEKLVVDLENKKSGSSAILTNMLGQSALMVVEKDLEKNEIVDVILWN